MKNYQDLQKLYKLSEISESCVDVDFTYAFISAMATSELELEQWMPMLFLSGESCFSNEQLATDFAQIVLAIYQQARHCFQQQIPLALENDNKQTPQTLKIVDFANGYLQAVMLIDNMQVGPEGETAINLQQTCLLLLDKLASSETEDIQKLALFEQLPSESEIISLLPTLLSRYGHQCLVGEASC
jgi:yecA family protein